MQNQTMQLTRLKNNYHYDGIVKAAGLTIRILAKLN